MKRVCTWIRQQYLQDRVRNCWKILNLSQRIYKHIRDHHVAKIKEKAFAYFHLSERSSAKLNEQSTHVWREILVKEWPWHNTTTETKHFYKSGSETMWPRKLSSPTLSMVPVVNSRMQFRRRHITHSFICWTLNICKMDFFFTF